MTPYIPFVNSWYVTTTCDAPCTQASLGHHCPPAATHSLPLLPAGPSPAGSPHITAWDTAAAVGASISCVATTTVCLVDQQPHIVVTRGDQRIDMHKARTPLYYDSAHRTSVRLLRATAATSHGCSIAAAPALVSAAAGGVWSASAQQCEWHREQGSVPRPAGPALPLGLLGCGRRLLRLGHGFKSARLPVAAAAKLLV